MSKMYRMYVRTSGSIDIYCSSDTKMPRRKLDKDEARGMRGLDYCGQIAGDMIYSSTIKVPWGSFFQCPPPNSKLLILVGNKRRYDFGAKKQAFGLNFVVTSILVLQRNWSISCNSAPSTATRAASHTA